MSTIIDRRTFLKGLPIAGGLAAMGTSQPQSGTKVVVLGGGLAGLAAAWNLMERGFDVTVLECAGHPRRAHHACRLGARSVRARLGVA